jgi:glucuronokinase
MIVRKRAYARVGLVGNPSDGFFGKTISSAIRNFAADVTLWESPELQLLPHRVYDSTTFRNLPDLVEQLRVEGYYGGTRLLLATCKRFADFCESRGIRLDDRNFTLSYETTIPRQIGLGGSSAIITATVRALMDFYGVVVDKHVPKPELPNLILSVEVDELGIAAGLQDRVIQVYGGTVFMDFSESLMRSRGYGEYAYLDSRLLPPLYLAYVRHGTESGKVHSDIRYRWNAGDPVVRDAMREWAGYAVEARDAILRRDYETLGLLFNRNFDLRRRIYGDKALGEANLEMVDIGRRFGCPAKFSGSGGAIVGIYRDEAQKSAVEDAYLRRGYAFTTLEVGGTES